MQARLLAAALASLAASAAPGASAMLVPDDDVHLNVGMQLDTRVERTSASDTVGADWDTVDDRAGEAADANWSIRRARLNIAGTYGSSLQFALSFAADNDDATGNGVSRTAALYLAHVDYAFYAGSGTQTIKGGLEYAFFNPTDEHSRSFLLPEERPGAALMTVRGVGAGYRYSMSNVDAGVDVMESLDPGKPAGNAGLREGMFYSARVEFAPMDGPKPAYQESYAGKAGEGILLGADVGLDQRDLSVAGVTTQRLGYGVEGLAHFDEISALLEVRWERVRATPISGGPETSIDQRVYTIQGGYAFPFESWMLEPCARLSLIDFDTQAGSTALNYDGTVQVPGSDAEWGDSGRQFDLGLNCYFKGHNNKLQLSFAHWQAKGGDAKANIWRLQHQLAF